MGAWGITMRESDSGLDLLRTIVEDHLKKVDFSTFSVAEAIEIVKADSLDEIRKANRGASADNLIYYISENFPRLFTEGAPLVAECLVDYYHTGKLTVTEYVGKDRDPADHHIKDFTVTKDDLKILLDELRKVQDPKHEIYQSWFEDSDRQKWLTHIQGLQQTLQTDSQRKPSITNQLKSAAKQVRESPVPPKAPLNHDSR